MNATSKRTAWIEQAQSRYGTIGLMGAYADRKPDLSGMIETAYEDPQIRRMARTIREECGDERLIRLKNVALRKEGGARAFTRYLMGKVVRDSMKLQEVISERNPTAGEGLKMIMASPFSPFIILRMVTVASFAYMLACDKALGAVN